MQGRIGGPTADTLAKRALNMGIDVEHVRLRLMHLASAVTMEVLAL